MILLIDNYDSFTYNIYDYLQQCHAECVLYRNNEISLAEIEKLNPEAFVFSPGPGKPSDHKLMFEILEKYHQQKPILGVCLGHQGIGEVFGASLINLPEVYHGLAINTKVVEKDSLFEGVPSEFKSGRYHSWAIDPKSNLENLVITAVDEKGNIMALRHKIYNIKGVQFHPESILTENGKIILKNWLKE